MKLNLSQSWNVICARPQCRAVAQFKLIKVIFVCESFHCHFRTLELIEYQKTLRIPVKQVIVPFCLVSKQGYFVRTVSTVWIKIQKSAQPSCKMSEELFGRKKAAASV
jgi:hypothetical protein